MLKLKVAKGNFRRELGRRVSQFRGGDVNIVLSIQPGNEWWYYQEWGTATHSTSPDAPSTAPSGYGIDPVKGEALSFPGPGGEQLTVRRIPEGHHKGVRPKGYIRAILDDLRTQIIDDVGHSLVESNFNREALKETILTRTMPHAQHMIAQSMEDSLGQSRLDGRGKLGSAKPSDVFLEESFIQDFSFD